MYPKLEDTSITRLTTRSKDLAGAAQSVRNLEINTNSARIVYCSNSHRYLVDDDEVVNTASRAGSGESSLFSQALGFLKQNQVGNQLIGVCPCSQ